MLVAMESTLGLRDRKKLETRADFVRAAVELYTEKGFEATTLDDICARAHYSRRTFFRYFSKKEDLVFADLPERVELFREKLQDSLADPKPLAVVRRELADDALAYAELSDEQLAVVDLWYREPQLRRRYIELVNGYEDAITGYLVSANAGEWRETEARIVATALCGVVRAVLRAHVTKPDELRAAFRAGFDVLERGLKPKKRRSTARKR